MAHELGHNLGLDHTGSRINEVEEFSEYGDPTSIMGNNWWSTAGADDIAAPHMQQIGAISGVLTASSAGVYTISPLDMRPETATHKQMLRVQSSVNGHWYYFSYRTGPQFYLTRRILLQKHKGTYYPAEYISSFGTGDTFMNIHDTFGVRVISITDEAAVLAVTFGCTHAEPQIGLFLRNPAWQEGEEFGRVALPNLAIDGASASASTSSSDGGNDVVTTVHTASPVQMWWSEKRGCWVASVIVRIADNNGPNCFPTQYVVNTEVNETEGDWDDFTITYESKTATLHSGTSCDVGVSFEAGTEGLYSVTIVAAGQGSLAGSANITLTLQASSSCMRQAPVIVPVLQSTSENISETSPHSTSGNGEEDDDDEDEDDDNEEIGAMSDVNTSHFYDYYSEEPLRMSFKVLNTNSAPCSEGGYTLKITQDSCMGVEGGLFSLSGEFDPANTRSWSLSTLTLTAKLRNTSLSNIGATCTAHIDICAKKKSDACTALTLWLHIVEGCYRTMPSIDTGTFTEIGARSSVGIPVVIRDSAAKPYSCRYSLDVAGRKVPGFLTSTVLDPTVVTHRGFGTTRIVFNGRDELTSYVNLTSLIVVKEFSGVAGPSITYATQGAVCVRNRPGISYSCGSTLVNEGAKEVTFSCSVSINNKDSWFCPNTTFMVNTIEDPRLEITYSTHSVNVYPGESGSVDIKFIYRTNTTIEEITFNFASEINDTEGLEVHGKRDTLTRMIGPCILANPSITAEGDCSQSGYNNRPYGFKVSLKNNNNRYCKSTSFKLTLNSSSFDNVSFSFLQSVSLSSQETKVTFTKKKKTTKNTHTPVHSFVLFRVYQLA